ncbi:tetratricopeptide repeat protein [Candidatus Uhrbacteria bacterium]|jgi:tetratricopeptide (TPR) repeat protein|nr:tetratricopeptide repeat protein [Candidatus Uhrbacteria bacterium]
MKKTHTHIINLFKKVTGGASHVALMQWSLVALLILLPLLILPSFGDIYGPIKQAALVILTTLAFLGWTLGVYRDQAWQRRKGWLIWTPALVLVGVIVSAALSTSGYAAWIGAGGQGFTAVVPFFAMVLLYVMVMHLGTDKKALRYFTSAAMLGVLLMLIYGLLEFFGLSLLTGEVGFPGFSLGGTFESMGLLGVIMSLFAAGIWIVADRSKADTWMPTRTWTIAFGVLGGLITVLTLFFMIVGDRWPMEIVMLVGSGLIVALGLHDPKKFAAPRRMLYPMFLFATSLLLLMFNPSVSTSIPVEIAPNYEASWEIGVATMNADGLFGSGPGTWMYDFTRFKPEVFNQGQFWQANFDHGNAHILTLFSTWGIVPTALLLIFSLWVIVKAIDALMLKRARENWQTIAVLFAVWMAFLVSRFVYSSDIVLDTFFWLLTGIFVAHIAPQMKAISFKTHGRASLLTSMSIVVAGIIFIMSSVVSIQWLSGEALIAKAADAQRAGSAADEIVNLVGNATRLNVWNAGYARSLAVAHLQRVDMLASDVEANAEAIVQGSDFAVIMAQRAIQLEPLDVRGYHTLGSIYESLSTVIGGSEVLALDQFRIAVELDPNNPLRHVRLSRALVAVSDNALARMEEGDERDQTVTRLLEEAEASIDEAARLKPNYAPAFYTRSLILERQGRLEEAMSQLVPLIELAPQDPVLRFELGVLLLRAGNKDVALQSFQAATTLDPTYANAKWYMVALYEEAGELNSAIRELEDLNILNPEDTIVLDKLTLLKQGLASQQSAADVAPLEGVDPPNQ